MPRPSPTPALTRRTNAALISLFMIMLWLPTLDTLFHLDWTRPPDENRALAPWPKAPEGWRAWQPWLAGLEAHFNDHFGCRKCLLEWQRKLTWSLFGEKYVHNTIIAKDGWMFFTESQMFEHYSGEIQLTPEQLHDWQLLLEKRRDWLARRGIQYVFVMAPDKHTIYPEELPDWFHKVRQQTTVDQFFNYMHAHSTVPVLDLREALRNAKAIHPTYLKNDTHWNNFGGFVAYQELMRTLGTVRPEPEPLPITAFIVTNRLDPSVEAWWQTNQYWRAPLVLTNPVEPGRELARIFGLNIPEPNAWFLLPKPELPVFKTKMAYPPRSQPWFTDNPQAKGRIIIFRDSFASSWVPFLAYHFNKVTYVWQDPLDADLISRDKPDIVVSEMVGRYFDVADPKLLMAKEALN